VDAASADARDMTDTQAQPMDIIKFALITGHGRLPVNAVLEDADPECPDAGS